MVLSLAKMLSWLKLSGLITLALFTNALCMWWKEIILAVIRYPLPKEESLIFINLIKFSRWLNASIILIHNFLSLKIFRKMMFYQLYKQWMTAKRNCLGSNWLIICKDFYLRAWWWWIIVNMGLKNKFHGKGVEESEDKTLLKRAQRLLLLGVLELYIGLNHQQTIEIKCMKSS